MYRTMISIGPNGEPKVWHLDGELVELRDRNSATGFGSYVRTAGDYIYKLDQNWHETRFEALTRAADELDKIADKIIDEIAVLRAEAARAREESRLLPAAGAATIGPGESAAGGRDETPAGQARCNGSPAEA